MALVAGLYFLEMRDREAEAARATSEAAYDFGAAMGRDAAAREYATAKLIAFRDQESSLFLRKWISGIVTVGAVIMFAGTCINEAKTKVVPPVAG